MKKITLLFFSIILIINGFSQKLTYYDVDWNKCKKKNASYYGTREYIDSLGLYYGHNNYMDGRTQMTGYYSSLKPDEIGNGHFRYFYNLGPLKSEGKLLNDLKEGTWNGFHKNGELKSTGKYIQDTQWGIWKSFYSNGQLSSIGKYVNGKKDSLWVDYHENGNKQQEIYHSQLEPMIVQGCWDEQGNQKEKCFEFYMLEEKPEFPGGDAALMKFLGDNTRYPKLAIKNKIEGRVFVSFVIDKTGEVIDVKVMRLVHPLLDAEALRVVSTMPDWRPGKQRGKTVKASYCVPLNFRLMKRTNKKSEKKRR